MDGLPAQLDDLVAFVRQQDPGGGPLDHLSTAVLASEQLGDTADRLIGHFVDEARRSGASWTEIGAGMGVSKQAAQKRFAARRTAEKPGPAHWPGLLSRFTDKAQEALARAQQAARAGGLREVSTAQVLLELTADPDSLAVRAIAAQGVSLDAVRGALEQSGGRGGESLRHVPFSRRCKKVLELSLREALRMGDAHVGTEHLLLGLLREEKSDASRVLREQGLNREAVSEWLSAESQS